MMRWFIIFLLVDIASFGQKVIEGKVLDKETTKPIPFASVGILGMPRGTSTNSDGEFSLAVPDTFSIKITCIGYKSLLLRSTDDFKFIELVPAATQLNEVVVHSKKANPSKIVRKAFASIRDNYDDESFLQKFFYRQYSKTDETCERFIEASVDVWKQHGFRILRVAAGEKEAMRINQLRRSLDITGMVQGQTPIFLDYVLQADIAAYQTRLPSDHLKMFDAVSNLKTDFSHYQFTFAGITVYDGQEVYKIKYESLADSILTSTGYIDAPRVSGSLHITTDTYAFLKTEEVRKDGTNTVRTSGYYLKHKDKYYPYHFVRESENHFKNSHFFHVELMAVEIKRGEKDSFPGSQLNREDLLSIPFDSTYWSTSTILKTTPLEEGLIRCLGGGNSLNKQFHLYKQYEQNVTNGGVEGEKKFNWLVNDSKGKRNLYICFWTSDFKSYLIDMEYFKRLNQVYKNKITFVLVSLETDEQRWRQLVKNYNYFADGMINYRIGTSSETGKKYNIKKAPVFILISKDGEVELNARPPSDPMLETDLINLIGKSK